MIQVGEVIGERYRIVSLIGRGGMSEVYLAEDMILGKQWAVKCLDHQTREEAFLLSRLNHPALPQVVDFIWDGREGYLVMEYIQGITIREYVQQTRGMETAELVCAAGQLCDVLTYLHKQNPPIIYRDMKPANIIRREDGSLRLIDFGIAREYKEEASQDTTCLGTEGYAAPEQFGEAQSDPRTDIYALGRTLYYMLGERDTPEGLTRILDRCCAVNPKQRYDSVAELKRMIRNWNRRRKYGLMKKGAIGFLILTLIFWIGGCSIWIRGSREKRENYEFYLQTLPKAKEYEDNLYLAIELLPGELDAYVRLADSYAIDGFTPQRQKRYMLALKEGEKKICQKEGYADLCFSIGCLYAFQSGKEQWAVHMRTAYPWFEQARRYRGKDFQFREDVLDALCLISHFFEKVNYSIAKDAISKKDYEELFRNMEKGAGLLKKNEKNETMQELSKLIENCLDMFENQWDNYVSARRIRKVIQQLLCGKERKREMERQWEEERVRYDEI